MKNENSVCYIDIINQITSIPNADKIEQATVQGWNSIVQKNSLKVGDLVACITTDAVIPEQFGERHGILNYLRTGNRVRTIRLKGVISDCIIIPIKELEIIGSVSIGDDLQDVLKIYKYEPPEKIITTSTGKKIRQRDNPNFNKYYKFPNIKNVPNIFNEEDNVVITRKIHGTNVRYGIVRKPRLTILDRIKKLFGNKWVDYEYIYGSHNVILGSTSNGFYSTNAYKQVAMDEFIEEDLWELAKHLGKETIGSGIIFYGEIYGPGIQGQKYNYNKNQIDVAFFDVEVNKTYSDREEFEYVTGYIGLPVVPVLYVGKYSKEEQDKWVTNQFIEGTKIPHEGIVITSITGDRSKIAKVINPDYLIFSEKHFVPDSH